MATANLSATFEFGDGTARTVTFSPFNPTSQAVTGFKVRVKQFNSGASQYANFRTSFLSDEGVSCTKIREATILTTEKTVLFAKSAEYAARALESGDENGDG